MADKKKTKGPSAASQAPANMPDSDQATTAALTDAQREELMKFFAEQEAKGKKLPGKKKA